MTGKTLQKIDVFISSPSDVGDERQAAIRVIDRLNRMQHIAAKYVLKPLAYENIVPAAVGEKPQTTVDKYMMEAGKADLFICILWHRMGTPVVHAETGEQFRSGTEYEFIDAYRANQKNGKPHMLLYRGLKPIPPDSDFEQVMSVQGFFKRFEGNAADFKGLYKSYKTVEEFGETLFHDLDAILAKNMIQPDADDVISVLPVSRPQRSDFFQHILVPPNYVPRPELLTALRAALLTDAPDQTQESTPQSNPLALHGMGGIGKSVIARALCEDEQVQAAFPDGILWAVLGQEPNIGARLREWISALGGTISENAPSEDSLKDNLAKLLESRTCLLIVDDIWHKKHADVFRVGGAQCRMLITTRDAEVARQLGAKIQPVPTMTLDEARRLLEEWADDKLADADPSLAARIADRLGRLPLALKLAGAQLQRKTPEDWLKTFDARKLKSRRAEDVHDSLEQTFGLSLDALQASERHLYAALAIFREDEAIPEIGISRLWQAIGNFDSEEAVELVDDLAARALLEVARTGYPGAVILHDLLRDFMSAELGEAQAQAHRALLEAYGATRKGVGWHTAPNDGYLFDHLVYHLQRISASDEIRALFADQHWMNVRVPQRNYEYDGYLADLTVAWESANAEAQRQSKAGKMPVALAESIRYALIYTSINSIAGNQIPAVVARAVALGLWEPGRALSISAKVPDAQDRVSFMAALLNTGRLSASQQIEAQQLGLAAVTAIGDPWRKALSLAVLVPYLTDRPFRRGLNIALSLDDKPGQVRALAAFARYLTGDDKDNILKIAFDTALAIDSRRSVALAALAPQLTAELQTLAFESALVLENERERVIVLVALAPYLDRDLLSRTLDAVKALEGQNERVEVLTALLPRLHGSQHAQALEDVLHAALALESAKERAMALAMLVPMLAGQQRHEVLHAALNAALSFEGKWGRAEALATIAPYVADNMLDRVLDAAIILSRESVFGGSPYAQVILALAPLLREKIEMLTRALDAAEDIEGDVGRAEALAALAPHLDGLQRTQAIQHALEAALRVRIATGRSEPLIALVPHLSAIQLDHVLNTALTIADEENQVKALASLARNLGEKPLKQTLEEGLAIALAIQDDGIQAEALAVLAPYLTGDLLIRALSAAISIVYGTARTEALSALASRIPDDLVQRAVDAAMQINSKTARIEALAALAGRLSGDAKIGALEEVLAVLPAVDWQRAAILVKLAPQLTGDLLTRALGFALEISDDWRRTDVLVALAPHVENDLLQRIVESALAMQDEVVRVRTITALIPRLSDEQKNQLLDRGLESALKLPEEPLFGGITRGEALAGLAPQLDNERLQNALRSVFAIGKAVERAKAMAAFLPQIQALPNAPDQAMILNGIRQAMLTYLLTLKSKKRADVLDFCVEERLFARPICSADVIEAITACVIEICRHWQWL